LREHLLCEDQKEMIKYDKKLANNYFKGVDTCYNCELFSKRLWIFKLYCRRELLYLVMNKFDDVESSERDIKYTAIGCEFYQR
jgi:hypothetical protein